MKKLNLGCGNDIKPGYINLDIAALPGVDVVHDLSLLPLPFASEEFDEILCKDILEHLEYIPLLREIHRILKKGGTVNINVPHYSSRDNYIDPTHKKMFSIRTFDFFVKNSSFNRDYYFDFHFSKNENLRISFKKGLLFYNHIIEPLVNINHRTMNLYDMTGLCYLFPASDININLIK